MGSAVSNWWTTVAGILTGVGQYIAQFGGTMPDSPASWASFVLGLGIAILGILAKDGVIKKAP